MITKEMEKTEDWVDSLIEYVRVITPVEKTGTVHAILEETLKEYQSRLDEKKIEVTKELQTNLPETIVPDEHLRYLLRSLLQYAIDIMPPSAFLQFSTRSSVPAATKEQIGFAVVGRGIEILVKFRAIFERSKGPQAGLKMIVNKERAILKFQIWSLEEVVKRNQGNLIVEVDQEKEEISISLKFPIERRRVVYYQAGTRQSTHSRL